MTITRKIVLDDKGEPTEVIIPYGQFVEMMEIFGLDLSKSDQDDLREALKDSRDKRRENFVSASEV
jgi:hypothetical protein